MNELSKQINTKSPFSLDRSLYLLYPASKLLLQLFSPPKMPFFSLFINLKLYRDNRETKAETVDTKALHILGFIL